MADLSGNRRLRRAGEPFNSIWFALRKLRPTIDLTMSRRGLSLQTTGAVMRAAYQLRSPIDLFL
jgi:hypothetical protein